ncbi:MAG: acyltransferase [Bacteroidales bacterium]|nr:acyltransferase [Bacteroidales bacterium]
MNHSITTGTFSKEHTSIIKGVAILLILFHNFFHWIAPMNSMENEFCLNANYIHEFFKSFADSPLEFVNILFSYLGHYGVEIFIFISGFGLAKSFGENQKSWDSFMLARVKKLYPLLLISLLTFFFTRISIYYALPTKEELTSMLYKLLFIHTFIPGESMTLDGPLWFFGLIIQLYIFFPLLFKLINKHGLKAFVFISAISYLIVYLVLNLIKMPDELYIMQHCFGHFPEFCLGILMARNDTVSGNLWFFITALVTFVLGNFYSAFFPLTNLSVTYIFFCIFIAAFRRKSKPNIFGKGLVHIGNISMLLFATHGMFRWQFVCLAKNYDHPLVTIVFALLFFMEAVFVALAAKPIYSWMVAKLNKKG